VTRPTAAATAAAASHTIVVVTVVGPVVAAAAATAAGSSSASSAAIATTTATAAAAGATTGGGGAMAPVALRVREAAPLEVTAARLPLHDVRVRVRDGDRVSSVSLPTMDTHTRLVHTGPKGGSTTRLHDRHDAIS
tara:strand:- start:88 stop:495 length:408 start_codon:yes stop_codon:yes gene_type:complete